jgi:hypothetical protein
VSSPDPWGIYVATGGVWRLAFARYDQHIWRLGIRRVGGRRAVVEKVPIYRRSDANCCPSAFRYRVVRWNGERFVTKRYRRLP